MLLHPRPLLQHLLLSPAGRTLLTSLLLWLLAFTYCRHAYSREPHSAFFQSAPHIYELRYSAFREREALSYIDSLSNNTITNTNTNTNTSSLDLSLASAKNTTAAVATAAVAKEQDISIPHLCLAFATIQREGKQYIDAAIGSLLQGLSKEERRQVYLYVLFANTRPEVHGSWEKQWLRDVVDKMGSYDVTAEELEYLRVLEEERNFREKGVFDYLYALDVCYKTQAPYIVIFEDDIIFANGWLAKTRHALKKIEHLASDPRNQFANWIYLRLFYTETFLRWGPDHFWYRNMIFTLMLGAGVGYLVLRCTALLIPRARKYLDHYTLLMICLVTIPSFIALGFMLGPYNFFPSDVFVLNEYGCCSQALVFPREQVPSLVEYLRKEKSGQTDMMIEDYATLKGLNRLALKKQVVQHVGLVSSRGNLDVNTRDIWAFWFELNDPERLRREHDRLVEVDG